MALLVAGGLFQRSLSRLMAVDPGFSPEGLATIWYTIPQVHAGSIEARLRFHEEVTRAVAAPASCRWPRVAGSS